MTIVYYLFIFLFLFTSVILCAVVLMQESKSSGLGASFGSDSGDSLFGTSTPQILKKITAYLSVAFFIGCVILSIWTKKMGEGTRSSFPSMELTDES